MSVIGGQNTLLVSNGLVYALDFNNSKTSVSGSDTAKSLIPDTVTTSIIGGSAIEFTSGKSIKFNYPWTGYIQRTNALFDFSETSSFTITVGVNVSNITQPNSGSLFIQNSNTVKFAANISTSSLDIGFYYPSKTNYYTR